MTHFTGHGELPTSGKRTRKPESLPQMDSRVMIEIALQMAMISLHLEIGSDHGTSEGKSLKEYQKPSTVESTSSLNFTASTKTLPAFPRVG